MTTNINLDRCHRIIADLTNEVFYQVESESTDAEYEVRYNTTTRRFTCTCPAGQRGFANCKDTCKHVRWSVEHAKQVKAEVARLAKIETLLTAGLTQAEATQAASASLIVDGKPADIETLVRVFGARASGYPSEYQMEAMAAASEARAFSLMRK